MGFDGIAQLMMSSPPWPDRTVHVPWLLQAAHSTSSMHAATRMQCSQSSLHRVQAALPLAAQRRRAALPALP